MSEQSEQILLSCTLVKILVYYHSQYSACLTKFLCFFPVIITLEVFWPEIAPELEIDLEQVEVNQPQLVFDHPDLFEYDYDSDSSIESQDTESTTANNQDTDDDVDDDGAMSQDDESSVSNDTDQAATLPPLSKQEPSNTPQPE